MPLVTRQRGGVQALKIRPKLVLEGGVIAGKFTSLGFSVTGGRADADDILCPDPRWWW
jgi:hypothetical protein